MDIEVEVTKNENSTQETKDEIVYKKYSQEEIDAKRKELEDLKQELQKKQYLVSEDIEIGKKILNWLKNKATWNYSESIGVVKLYEVISNIVNDPKNKKLYLGMGEITAINYLLQKTTGVGYDSAKEIFQIVQPIVEIINNSINKDSKKVQELEFELASMIEGIQPYTEREKEEKAKKEKEEKENGREK